MIIIDVWENFCFERNYCDFIRSKRNVDMCVSFSQHIRNLQLHWNNRVNPTKIILFYCKVNILNSTHYKLLLWDIDKKIKNYLYIFKSIKHTTTKGFALENTENICLVALYLLVSILYCNNYIWFLLLLKCLVFL